MSTTEKEQECRCVVRLTRSAWNTNRGLFLRTDLTFMRRLSRNFNLLDEDVRNIGAADLAKHITNLHECKDGLYKFVMCNPKTDWETGMVDDYDYKLVPFKP